MLRVEGGDDRRRVHGRVGHAGEKREPARAGDRPDVASSSRKSHEIPHQAPSTAAVETTNWPTHR